MPTPTYDLIEEKVVVNTSTTSITFSSIPSTYKDLIVEFQGGDGTGAGYALAFQVNNDTGTNYSSTILLGTGSAAQSSRYTSVTYGAAALAYYGMSNDMSTTAQIHFMSYANTNMNKTVIERSGRANGSVESAVTLWRSTAAITSIKIGNGFSLNQNLVNGSTFRLWGVSG